jgi:hypothetical protein
MVSYLQATDALRSRIPPPIMAILKDAIVTFFHITEDYELIDLLHITQISSKWQLAPFYKTGGYNSVIVRPDK